MVRVTDCVRNLGVQFDAEMSMESHVTAVCKSAIFYLREDQTVSDSSSDRASCLCICHKQTGYWQCTALSTASEANHITQRLQKIQNWAARLIDGAMRYSHATPLLKKLHWLPIAVRVEFKILLLTHRALNGQAPGYIGPNLDTI